MNSRIIFSLIVPLLLATIAKPACQAAELYVGGASVSITPDMPVSLTGQMHLRIARKVESEVTATALVLESREADKTVDYVIFVSCDLVCIRGGILEAVREQIKGRLKEVDVNKIILNATHTHTAPTMVEGRYSLPATGVMQPAKFVNFASKRIAGAIVKAWESKQPASAGWGLGHAVVAENRRALYSNGLARMYGRTNTKDFRGIEGYEDHGLEVLFFWNAKQELIATAINVACPAQAVEGRSAVNADFWHPVRETLRAKYGKDLHVLTWAGAGGDQVPRSMYRKKSEERMRTLRGLTLLDEIARRIVVGWEEAYAGASKEKHTDPVLVHKVKTIELPLRIVTEEDYARVKKEVTAYAKDPRKVWIKNWKQSVLDRYALQKSGKAKPYRMELHTLRLGDIAIGTNDFELFNDFGTQMKSRSPALQTFVIQLCGAGSYVPNKRATLGGSYSAVIESNLVGHKGGQVLTEQTIDSIKELFPAKSK
ncbi:MAG: hypothetical protein QM501_03135 [Gimesia sp.]